MPELPEVTTYVEAFRRRIVGQPLQAVRIRSPSLLRTFHPPLSSAHGRAVVSVRRLAKRVVWEMEGGLFLVFHLMITGRFHTKPAGAAIPRRNVHGAFDFPQESYFLTEMGPRKKASLHVVEGEEALAELDPGGVDPLQASPEQFARALTRENRTLKRALTDPRILSGIGNAHSDEILHAARLSPVQLTLNLTDEEVDRLRQATVENLTRWTKLLRDEVGDGFPERVTAFHPRMAVHGRYGQPCPVCGDAVQRIVYADRETNYCPTCQTKGKLMADRALSRLLQKDWPRTLEELEDHRAARRPSDADPGDTQGG